MHNRTLATIESQERPRRVVQPGAGHGSQALIKSEEQALLPHNGFGQRLGHAPSPEDWIEEWERRTAAAMVKDLDASGVDQDLEALRAGWASSARPQRCDKARTRLNQRGDVATRRLQTVESLRQVADGRVDLAHVNESSVPGFLSVADAQTQKSRTHSHDTEANIGGRETKPARPRPSPHRTSSPLKSLVEEDDPWIAWERRWADTFEQMSAARQSRQQSYRKVYSKEAESSKQSPKHDGMHTGEQKANPRVSQRDVRGRGAQENSARNNPTPPKGSDGYTSSSASHSKGSYAKASPNHEWHSHIPPPRTNATGSGGARQREPPDQPRGKPPVPQKPPQSKVCFISFADYDEAWCRFEANSSTSNVAVGVADIPWPLDLQSVSGIGSNDTDGERKKKLRAALLRWHPDKWTPILNRIKETDKEEVTERVKEVTRRILAEKEKFS